MGFQKEGTQKSGMFSLQLPYWSLYNYLYKLY